MYNKEINRKFIFFLMVILAISMTSLGMRVPLATGISSSGKPKPRPRAIIKNQIETCKQIVKQIPPAVTITGFKPLNYNPVTLLPSLPALNASNPFAVSAQKRSRASPQLS